MLDRQNTVFGQGFCSAVQKGQQRELIIAPAARSAALTSRVVQLREITEQGAGVRLPASAHLSL